MQGKVENDVGVFWLEDGVLRCRVKPNERVQTPEEAADSVRIFREIGGGVPRPAVIEIAGARGLSRGAREAYVGPGAGEIFSAAAVVFASSAIARALGNFIMAVSRPAFPMRLFEHVEDAEAWIRTHARPR
jgi:hypothetical protein